MHFVEKHSLHKLPGESLANNVFSRSDSTEPLSGCPHTDSRVTDSSDSPVQNWGSWWWSRWSRWGRGGPRWEEGAETRGRESTEWRRRTCCHFSGQDCFQPLSAGMEPKTVAGSSRGQQKNISGCRTRLGADETSSTAGHLHTNWGKSAARMAPRRMSLQICSSAFIFIWLLTFFPCCFNLTMYLTFLAKKVNPAVSVPLLLTRDLPAVFSVHH